MIKKWVTVISWHNGVAFVKYSIKSPCNCCISHVSYSDQILLCRSWLKTTYILSIPSKEPLMQGQKVILGITKNNLLRFAILIYLPPLINLLTLVCIFQILFGTDFAAMCAALFGGISGFLFARSLSSKFIAKLTWQPVILNSEHLFNKFKH